MQRFKFLTITQLADNLDDLFRKELQDKKIVIVDEQRRLDLEKRKIKANPKLKASLLFSEFTNDEQIEMSLTAEEIAKFSLINNKLEVSFEGLNPNRLKQFFAVRDLFALNFEARTRNNNTYKDRKFDPAKADMAKQQLITAAMQYYLHTEIGKEYKLTDPNKSLVYRDSPSAMGVSETNQIDQETQNELNKINNNLFPSLFSNSSAEPKFWNAYLPSTLLASIENAVLAGDNKLVTTVSNSNDKFIKKFADKSKEDKAAADKHAQEKRDDLNGKQDLEGSETLSLEQLHRVQYSDQKKREGTNYLRTQAANALPAYQDWRDAKLAAKSKQKIFKAMETLDLTWDLSHAETHTYSHDLKNEPTELKNAEDYAANKDKFDNEFKMTSSLIATFFNQRKSKLEHSFNKLDPKFLSKNDERIKSLDTLKEESAKKEYHFKK